MRYLIALFFALIPLSLFAGEARVTRAHLIPEKIRIDGNVDKRVWAELEPIGEFVQRVPKTGAPPTERTEVKIAYTRDALYFAIRCFDSQPKRIIALEMGRDAGLNHDDNVEILLDTFSDGRNAYYFSTNPAGALVEGRITDNSETRTNWDAVWNVRTRIDERGWTAEVEIPFKSLSFDPKRGDWGFNIARQVGRLREESRWASPEYDVQFNSVAKAGRLEALEGLTQGVGLDLKPYGVGGLSHRYSTGAGTSSVRTAGLDAFYRITPNLVSSTTLNTDFAETEVDERRVNLTRFPLFFPEKRAFFLEDAGVFDFARSERDENDVLPFFSRRIGLFNGKEVPILVGEKLTGKVGRFDVGMMEVRTRDSDVAPARNFAIGRVKVNFLKESYIGALFTGGDPSGTGSNRVGGIDLRLATSDFRNRGKNLALTLFASKSATTGISGRDNAYGAEIAYPNDLLFLRGTWRVIGDNYDPALGFVERPGTRFTDLRAEIKPRPGFWHIRQMSHEMQWTSYYNLSRRAVESRQLFLAPINWEFENGEHLEFNWNPTFERLFEPFEIHPGVVIPAGSYWFHRGQAEFSTAENKPLVLEASWEFGTFYNGTNHELTTEVKWRKDRHLATSLALEQFFVNLPAGKFRTRLVEYRLDYSFTPFLTLANFVQYDTDSRNIGLQSRFRWILSPGNDLFFVLNHAWQQNTLDRWEAYQTKVRAKFGYTFRF